MIQGSAQGWEHPKAEAMSLLSASHSLSGRDSVRRKSRQAAKAVLRLRRSNMVNPGSPYFNPAAPRDRAEGGSVRRDAGCKDGVAGGQVPEQGTGGHGRRRNMLCDVLEKGGFCLWGRPRTLDASAHVMIRA